MNTELIKKLSEPLDIEAVDFRIQSINKGGYATILAYKDARVDMNRLDEVIGAENWQRDYKEIDGTLYCGVAIKFEEWVWKWDAGTESFSDKEKGRASDAFKRACFNWGIGRELYDYPVIQIKLNSDEFTVENGKARQTYKLNLKDWDWAAEFENGKVKSLKAFDSAGNTRFSFPDGKVTVPKSESQTAKSETKELQWLNVMDKEKNFTPQWLNVVEAINSGKITTVEEIRKHYKVSNGTESKINEILNYQYHE